MVKIDKLDNKKPRLLKKLRLGDFKELGYAIAYVFNAKTEEEIDAFLEDLIACVEEQELLVYAAGAPGESEAFLGANQPYQDVAEDNANAVAKFLIEHPLVSDVKMSDPIDLNYGIQA